MGLIPAHNEDGPNRRMMKHSRKWSFAQLQPWHLLVVLSVLVLALLGRMPDSQAGWMTCPRHMVSIGCVPALRRPRYPRLSFYDRLHTAWRYGSRSWLQPLLRSLLLATLWFLSGCWGAVVVIGWPWLSWLWQAAAVGWPELAHQPLWCAGHWLLWQGQRVLLMGYLGAVLCEVRLARREEMAFGQPVSGLLLGLGCQQCGKEESWVEVTCRDDGSYQATLCGHFSLQVSGDDPYRVRLLEGPGQQRGSRRTRDGRTPFVRQMQLSRWFGLSQPEISKCYPFKFYGWGFNTGDGIKLAQKVGAAIWHMDNLCGGNCAWFEDDPANVGYSLSPGTNNYICVTTGGERFCNEPSQGHPHGGWRIHSEWNNSLPGWDRIPTWVIFDHTALSAGPLGPQAPADGGMMPMGRVMIPEDLGGTPSWSSDNSVEIEKGWIRKGDTIRELAQAIGGSMDPDVLEATVERYNGFCAAGEDPDFGRLPEQSRAFGGGTRCHRCSRSTRRPAMRIRYIRVWFPLPGALGGTRTSRSWILMARRSGGCTVLDRAGRCMDAAMP
jgi:hypothetical protein